jgi:methylglutaconyl-CoA hydratase
MGVTNIKQLASQASAALQKAVVFTESLQAPHCGRIRIIRLNRPAAHNAISLELLSGLKAEIESISKETDREKGTRAVIIASNTDDHFCVGADLKERRSFTLHELVHPHTFLMPGLLLKLQLCKETNFG